MKVSRDLEGEANPFSSINVIDSDVEEAGNEMIVLGENESDDELIHVEERHFIKQFIYLLFLTFMSDDYVEESFYE